MLVFFLFRAEYECFQIELAKNYGVPEWREDLKKVLLKSGVENKSMVFLFSDTQVWEESGAGDKHSNHGLEGCKIFVRCACGVRLNVATKTYVIDQF